MRLASGAGLLLVALQCTAAGFATASPQNDPTEQAARLALAAGDYPAALALAAELDGPRERALLTAEFLTEAREWEGATASVERGLAAAPEDLLLLWRGAYVRLWAQDAEGALAYTERLERAVAAGEARGELTGPESASWYGATAGFRADAETRLEHGVERDLAVTRARWVVLGVGGLVLGLGSWLVWGGVGREGR